MVTEFQVTEEDASHLQWTIEVFLKLFTKLHPMLVLPPICTILFTCHIARLSPLYEYAESGQALHAALFEIMVITRCLSTYRVGMIQQAQNECPLNHYDLHNCKNNLISVD